MSGLLFEPEDDDTVYCCQGAEESEGLVASKGALWFVLYLNRRLDGQVSIAWADARACPLCATEWPKVDLPG